MPCVNAHSYHPRNCCQRVWLLTCYFPVFVVLGIVALMEYPYFKHFVGVLLSDQNSRGVSPAPLLRTWSLVGGILSMAGLLVSYLRVVGTSPGYVSAVKWSQPPRVAPKTDVFAAAQIGTEAVVSQLSAVGELRYCRRCEVYRPDDAQHCSDCGRCVHRMDHHCPWVNNCVGEANEKYFFLFISYIAICGGHISLTTGYGIWLVPPNDHPWSYSIVVVVALMGAIFSFVMSGFALFYLGAVANDMVQLERSLGLRHKGDGVACCDWRHYGLATRRILGSRPALWLVPIASSVPEHFLFSRVQATSAV